MRQTQREGDDDGEAARANERLGVSGDGDGSVYRE